MENFNDKIEYSEIEGTVESITYRNEDNGYTVLTFNNGAYLQTVVGSFGAINTGEMLKLRGRPETHKVYGSQFHAFEYEYIRPATADAIKNYLSNGGIKGIGPATAGKIISIFGDKALEVIENEPHRLCQIRGISLAKAEKISKDFVANYGMQSVMIDLAEMGLTTDESLRAFKVLGVKAAEAIKENPYVLYNENIHINFQRVEIIARSNKILEDNHFRVESGIMYVVKHNTANGHTCLPKHKVIAAACKLLNLEPPSVESACERLICEEQLISFDMNDVEFVAHPDYYKAEKYAAGRISTFLNFPPPPLSSVENRISAIEIANGIKYHEKQKDAILTALSKGTMIITGGPGTGKTTTIKAIITIMRQFDMEIVLAAPTGRAAKRMTDLTGYEAKTIHRLLEAERGENNRTVFARNDRNPIEGDVIIVDEISMLDSILFEALLRATRLGCRLIMVGDSDQLPAVGAGNVLSDLIASEKIPVVRLDTIFRQAMESLIVTNAHKIVSGEYPEVGGSDGDFFVVHESNAKKAANILCDLLSKRLPSAYGFNPLEDIQLLCPSKKGELGTFNMNMLLSDVFHPPEERKVQFIAHGKTLFLGEKVIQTKNNYDILWTKADGSVGTGVFNGDIGIICSIDRSSGTLTVRYDDRMAVYTTDDIEHLEPAYAITVHKSQGSEYECVVIPVIGNPPQLSFRNLLYTGVTRAKKLLILVGTDESIKNMVDNNKKTLRYTALEKFLTER